MHSVMVLFIWYLHGIRVKQLGKHLIYNSIYSVYYINSIHFNNFDIVMLGQINVGIQVLS